MIAGSAKGRRLSAPRGLKVRPTAAKVREALFSILGRETIADAVVLDLYCGIGSLGIEALSRGARCCTFVDQDGHSLKYAHDNLDQLGLRDRAQLVKRRIPKRLCDVRGGPYDLVFSDPPYDDDVLAELGGRLAELTELVAPDVIWVHELASRRLPDAGGVPAGWELDVTRRYGDTGLLVLARSRAESAVGS